MVVEGRVWPDKAGVYERSRRRGDKNHRIEQTKSGRTLYADVGPIARRTDSTQSNRIAHAGARSIVDQNPTRSFVIYILLGWGGVWPGPPLALHPMQADVLLRPRHRTVSGKKED